MDDFAGRRMMSKTTQLKTFAENVGVLPGLDSQKYEEIQIRGTVPPL
jgi:hypothetical protein